MYSIVGWDSNAKTITIPSTYLDDNNAYISPILSNPVYRTTLVYKPFAPVCVCIMVLRQRSPITKYVSYPFSILLLINLYQLNVNLLPSAFIGCALVMCKEWQHLGGCPQLRWPNRCSLIQEWRTPLKLERIVVWADFCVEISARIRAIFNFRIFVGAGLWGQGSPYIIVGYAWRFCLALPAVAIKLATLQQPPWNRIKMLINLAGV